MEWLSAIISTLTCCLIVFYRREMSPGVAGLVLSYALSICDAVSWLLRVATDVENAVVAAERVDEYSKVGFHSLFLNIPSLESNRVHIDSMMTFR